MISVSVPLSVWAICCRRVDRCLVRSEAIVFFAGEGEAEANCHQLLREYEFASKGKFTVEEVSPYQNLTRARELQTKYKFGSNENIVILDYDGKSKFLNSADMAEFEQLDQMAMMTGRRPQMVAFKGEELLTNSRKTSRARCTSSAATVNTTSTHPRTRR